MLRAATVLRVSRESLVVLVVVVVVFDWKVAFEHMNEVCPEALNETLK